MNKKNFAKQMCSVALLLSMLLSSILVACTGGAGGGGDETTAGGSQTTEQVTTDPATTEPLIPFEPYERDMTTAEGLILFTEDEMATVEVKDNALRFNGRTGGRVWLDPKTAPALNGTLTANLTSNFGGGLAFRIVDEDNFCFVCVIPSSDIFLVGEVVGGKQYVKQVTYHNTSSGEMSVQYQNKEWMVALEGNLVYYGPSPAGDQSALIAGQVGFFGYGVMTSTYDRFSYEPVEGVITEFPGVLSAKLEGQMFDALIDNANKKIVFYVAEGTATDADMTFVTRPVDAKFKKTGEDNNLMKYTYTYEDIEMEYTVEVQTVELKLLSITSGDMTVQVNADYPAVFDYHRQGTENVIYGESRAVKPSVYINDIEYPAVITSEKTAEDTVTYDVTVKDVVLGGVARDVKITYEYSVDGTTLTKKITSLEGDDEASGFRVRLNGAVLSLSGTKSSSKMAVAGNFFSKNTAIRQADEFSQDRLAFVFMSNGESAAAAYTKEQWDDPYSASIFENEDGKWGAIYETEYVLRLVDGTLVEVENRDGEYHTVGYEAYVYLCGDENDSGDVDWQDAALWTRKQVPQVPEELREFFNGGQWLQSAGAYPGNNASGAETTQGFTFVAATPANILEIQKQLWALSDQVGNVAYCYVGWQGQGHDYGWPNINEVVYNPALGDEADFVAVQKAITAYGGSLGFHLNMSDMVTSSYSWHRGNAENIFGNREPNTGKSHGTYYAGGWTYYEMNHYMDLPYALARQNDFVTRFEAPFLLYQDVMLDYPYGDYGLTEEHFAQMSELNRWGSLGTYAATEYYRTHKRTSGTFVFNNYQDVNEITSFVLAGQIYVHGMRNYFNEAEDYIWAILCPSSLNADNYLVGAKDLAARAFLVSYTNAYVSSKELLEYHKTGNGGYTDWSDGVRYEGNNKQGTMKITKDGKVVAVLSIPIVDGHVQVSAVPTGDVFVPAVDGSGRIFAYSTEGGTKTWDLTSDCEAGDYVLYRLTETGRVYVGELKPVDGKVTFVNDPETGYVLYPAAKAPAKETVIENHNTNADADASSRPIASNAVNPDMSPIGSMLEIVDPALTPEGGWSKVLLSLYKNWYDDNGNLRYYKIAAAGCASDGVADTFWQPEESDLLDGEAWISFRYEVPRTVKRLALSFEDTKASYTVVITGTDANGNTVTLYSGKASSGFEYTLSKAQTLTDIRMTVKTSSVFRLTEFAAYSA